MTDTTPRHSIIIYDITEAARLRKIARLMEDVGFRYQNSVFEVFLKPGQLMLLKDKIKRVINPDTDSVIIIPVCDKDWQKQLKYGLNTGIKEDDGTFKIL